MYTSSISTDDSGTGYSGYYVPPHEGSTRKEETSTPASLPSSYTEAHFQVMEAMHAELVSLSLSNQTPRDILTMIADG